MTTASSEITRPNTEVDPSATIGTSRQPLSLPQHEWEWISPEDAKAVLDRNDLNRQKKPWKVDEMATAMREGKYDHLNGQTIAFDTNGAQSDGRNRLEAVVASGVGGWFLVVRGVHPNTAQLTTDTGTPRTIEDALVIVGEKPSHAKVMASIIGNYIAFTRSGRPFSGGLRSRATNTDAIDVLRENPDIRDAAGYADRHRYRGLPASVVGVLWMLFSRVDGADASEFMEQLTRGTGGLDEGNPIFVLRKRLEEDAGRPKGHSDKLRSSQKAELTILAWNAWRSGVRDMRRLRLTNASTSFPQIHGMDA